MAFASARVALGITTPRVRRPKLVAYPVTVTTRVTLRVVAVAGREVVVPGELLRTNATLTHMDLEHRIQPDLVVISFARATKVAYDAALRAYRYGRDAAFALALTALACGPGARFEVRYAPGFSARPMTSSVLGVYREGRLSEADWSSFTPHLPSALRSPECVPGYGRASKARNSEAVSAVEAQVRAAGVGDEVLDMIAPAAEGEFILEFSMYGQPATSGVAPEGRARVLVAHGGGPEPMTSDASPRIVVPEAAAMEISASFYSTLRRQTVAALHMEYTGASLEDAFQEFAREFGNAFPLARCVGWNWETVSVVHELDAVGLPLRRFRLVPGAH